MKKRTRRRVAALILIILTIAGIWLLINSIFFSNQVPSNEPETIVNPTTEEKRVSMLAVGDNIGHERIYTAGDLHAGEYLDGTYNFLQLYQNVSDDIAGVDLAFINQESIIGGDSLGITGYPAFNSPKQLASDLTSIGFDVVNSASNHSLDKGYIGIENTIEIWKEHPEVLLVGVHNSQEDSDRVKTIERNGITFAFVGYTYGTNGYTTTNEYAVHGFDPEQMTADINRAKEASDVVIVSAHWGVESSYETNQMQKDNAQFFADLGVHLVIGHHPHVIQPMEWLTGKDGNQTLVAYSLGNFISTMESVDNQLEGMLSLDFVEKDGTIQIENVEWTMLINHFESSSSNIKEANPTVYKLSDYSSDLQDKHYILSQEEYDITEYFTKKTSETIGSDFKIN